ncbi:MAG: IS110 family transposase [Anaerolineae bacterium]|nr:IS110 family transposase [Anaerolineae bacterium]
MDIIIERSAGLDVHKKIVVACRIIPGLERNWQKDLRTFGTMTDDLLALRNWLREGGVTHVAMESTGVYWKPVYNVLESECEVLLANARHIKFVPGRKTDVKDAQWIAELLQHGLLKGSFIPPLPQRALRDLVRYRIQLVQERTREVNRIQKVLEDANIKLGSVASNVMGASGRAMLRAIVDGCEDPRVLADLAKGKLRRKRDELERALTGLIEDHHRLLLQLHLGHIDDLNDRIEWLNAEIDRLIEPLNDDNQLERLDAIPGVGRDVAQVILAELGTDMSRFPTAAHAASWAGLAPVKNERAGRNQSARTSPGKRFLKVTLVQAAHAARSSRGTYLSARYRRLAARRGRKRAAIAVARSILVSAYHMLRDGTDYVDLGGDYFDKRNEDQVQRRLVKRLEGLGLKVTLEPASVSV